MKIFEYDSVTSTNDLAKELVLSNQVPFAVSANHQSQGRGTNNRKFYSPKNQGLYVSIAIQPKFSIDQLQDLVVKIGHVISKTLNEYFNIKTYVKLYNDVMYDQKKLCGILIETAYNSIKKNYDSIIIGFGLNVFQNDNLDKSLKDIYISLEEIVKKPINKDEIKKLLISNIIEFIDNEN